MKHVNGSSSSLHPVRCNAGDRQKYIYVGNLARKQGSLIIYFNLIKGSLINLTNYSLLIVICGG